MAAANPLLFTVSEIAQQLGVSNDVVRGHIASGRLVAINVGLGSQRPRWRITPEALDQFLNGRTARGDSTSRRRKAPGRVIEFF